MSASASTATLAPGTTNPRSKGATSTRDARARHVALQRGVGCLGGDDGDGEALLPEDRRQAGGRAHALGAHGDRVPRRRQLRQAGGQAGAVPVDGLEPLGRDGRGGRRVGHRDDGQDRSVAAFEQPVVGDVQPGEGVPGPRRAGFGTGPVIGDHAPGDRQRAGQGRLLVVELGRPVAHAPGVDEHHPPGGAHEVGQHAVVLDEPGQPRFHAVEQLPLGETFPLRAPPRLGVDEGGGPGAHLVGGDELAAPEQLHRAQAVERALVAGIELGQTVDLVPPQVDAHRQLGGRREDVDDPAAHGQLATVLDLVLASVPEAHEPGHEGLLVDALSGGHVHRLGHHVERTQALQQGAHGRHHHGRGRRRVAQVPQQTQALPHGRDLGAHPLEGERVPGREQRHGLLAHERPHVVGHPLGVGHGGGDDEQRPALSQAGQAGQHEGSGGVGDRQRGGPRRHGVDHGGLVAQQGGQRAQAHRVRLPTSWTRAGRGRARAGQGASVLKWCMAPSTPSVAMASTASAATSMATSSASRSARPGRCST